MKAVWKSKVVLEDIQEIEMPVGSEILKFHQQGNRFDDDVSLWYLCETENPKEKRTFALVATGVEVLEGYKYIGTIWMMNGNFVLHLFEVIK